ncbi:putative ubiquitin-conjugating enzyme/RWD [Helianthus annuus]|nr:putative ubiquitin-conjugating enzyme/RWD [Helianthus annuus]
MGVEGTSYHDCLFSYDVCFLKTYPHDPPVRFIISFSTVAYGLILLCNKGCSSCLSGPVLNRNQKIRTNRTKNQSNPKWFGI